MTASPAVRDALLTALEERTVDPAALIALDPSSLLDGNRVDDDALRAWVAANSTSTAPMASSREGSLDAGRAAYDRRHQKPAARPTDPVLPLGSDAYARRHPQGLA